MGLLGVHVMVQRKQIRLGTMRLQVRSLPLLNRLRIQHCCVGHRHGSDPTLLWLWYRLAATAPFRPLVWEPPYASGAVLKKG